MAASALLPQLVARWAQLYADHKALSAGVTYVHLAGVLVGGGFAVAADRAVLRLSTEGGPELSRDLASLATVHRWVIAGLGVMFVSGVFMMLADLDTYLTSLVFWTKMGLIVLLIAGTDELFSNGGGTVAWVLLFAGSVAAIYLVWKEANTYG